MTKRSLPSLTALRAFEAAGRHGRMTLAAEELHVTHGAISRQVRSLEAALGVRLFEGPKSRLALTEAGAALLPSLTAALDQMEAGVRMVADKEEGPLTLSCLGTFMMRWLLPRLYRFTAAHPRIDIRLSASAAPVAFSREGFDLAIRVGEGPWPEDAEVIELFPDHTGPVLSPDLASRHDLGDPEGLLSLPKLHSKSRPGAWSAWCRLAGLPEQHDHDGAQFEHLYFMLEAALSGLGVGVAPWAAVVSDVEAGRLVAPFGFRPSGKHYVALARKRPNRKVTIFCDWLQGEVERLPARPATGQTPERP